MLFLPILSEYFYQTSVVLKVCYSMDFLKPNFSSHVSSLDANTNFLLLLFNSYERKPNSLIIIIPSMGNFPKGSNITLKPYIVYY